MLDGCRQGSSEKDQDPGEVYESKVKDGVIFAKILVGHYGPKDGSHIAPELKEVGQSCGPSLPKTY